MSRRSFEEVCKEILQQQKADEEKLLEQERLLFEYREKARLDYLRRNALFEQISFTPTSASSAAGGTRLISATSSGGGEDGPVVDQIRAALSVDGQARYDAATAGNFITVSSVDYAAVFSSLSATKYIMDDTDLTSAYSGWARGFNFAYNDTTNPLGSIATASYIVGFAFSGFFAAGTLTAYLRTGTQSNNTHTKIGSNIVFSPPGTGNRTIYFIRKAPSTPTSTKTYISFYVDGTGISSVGQVSGKSNYPGYYSQFINTNTWTLWTGGYQTVQVLGTTTKSW